jgi:hypothetical protein
LSGKRKRRWLEKFLDPQSSEQQQEIPKEIAFQPALRQIGTTDCPVCDHEVAVFLTKTNRPFLNCSFCLARIFYNGRESMRLLRKRMKPLEDD